MRFSWKTLPKQIMLDQKEKQNMKYFNYLGSTIKNVARCIRKIKYRIAIAKAAIYKKKALGTSKLDIKFMEETSKVLHFEHSFVWCWNLNSSASRSEIPRKFWSVLLEKGKKISWTDRVINEEVLNRVKEERKILRTIKRATRMKCRPWHWLFWVTSVLVFLPLSSQIPGCRLNVGNNQFIRTSSKFITYKALL